MEFQENGLFPGSAGYGKAVDDLLGQKDADCPRSASSVPTVWLEIDLGQLYSLTKIALLSRFYYGRGARVYVGQTAVSSDGFTDYRCGSSVTIPYDAPSTLTDFGCDSTNWVRYVSIRRNGYDDFHRRQHLAVCEIEAYYDPSEDPGISVKRNGIEATTTLNVTKGDIVECGSSKGDFIVTWMFPNGTVISNQATSPSIRQAINSMGYQDLVLSPLTSVPPNGQYTCEYTANEMKKTKSLQLNFDMDCQLGAWSACSSSCGRGKRRRTIIHDKRGKGKDCMGQYSEDCATVSCGLLDLIAIKATATQGPGIFKTFRPSYAIDDDPLYSSDSICATPGKSTNPWLRIDLQSRYTIREVQVQFYGRNAPGHVTVNIGNSLVNNGTNNAQCGSPFLRGTVRSPSNSFVCSPSLWGRYVILQKTFSSGGSGHMQVCDVQVYHELDAVIVYNGSPVVSGSVFADSGVALPHPVTCGVNPDPTGLNALLNIEWKNGNNQAIPLLSSNPQADVVQTEVNNQVSLEIRKAPLVDTKYVCHYTWIDKSKKSLEFDLLTNVDCGWSAWSSCSGSSGVGSRKRTPDKPVKKHAGKDCIGMAEEECDTKQPPLIAQPTTPGPPYGLLVEAKTSESLYLTWNTPKNPNGNILGYEIIYWRTDEPSEKMAATSSLHPTTAVNLTELNANTNYSVTVKTVNDAKNTSPKSQPAVVSSMTLTTTLIDPASLATPSEGAVDFPKGTITLTAPDVSARDGPISYVKVIVYMGDSPPDFVTSDMNIQGNGWHEAAYFSFEEYERSIKGRQYSVGNGEVTSDGLTSYTNNPLDEGYEYSVYIAFYYGNTQTSQLVVSSSPFTFTLGSTKSDRGSLAIVFIVLFVLTLSVLVIVSVAFVCQRRKSSTDLVNVGNNVYETPSMELTSLGKKMTDSRAYTVPASYKKGGASEDGDVNVTADDKQKEGDYEDIST